MIFSERDFHESAFRLVVATDDGTAGFHGNALAALSSHPLPDLIIACGPTPMLKAVQEFALGHNLHCQLSLEQRMGCGYGACLTCSCRTMSRDGEEHYARVCACLLYTSPRIGYTMPRSSGLYPFSACQRPDGAR